MLILHYVGNYSAILDYSSWSCTRKTPELPLHSLWAVSSAREMLSSSSNMLFPCIRLWWCHPTTASTATVATSPTHFSSTTSFPKGKSRHLHAFLRSSKRLSEPCCILPACTHMNKPIGLASHDNNFFPKLVHSFLTKVEEKSLCQINLGSLKRIMEPVHWMIYLLGTFTEAACACRYWWENPTYHQKVRGDFVGSIRSNTSTSMLVKS